MIKYIYSNPYATSLKG